MAVFVHICDLMFLDDSSFHYEPYYEVVVGEVPNLSRITLVTLSPLIKAQPDILFRFPLFVSHAGVRSRWLPVAALLGLRASRLDPFAYGNRDGERNRERRAVISKKDIDAVQSENDVFIPETLQQTVYSLFLCERAVGYRRPRSLTSSPGERLHLPILEDAVSR